MAGYLDDNLPQRKMQIVECQKLYKLLLRVRHHNEHDAQLSGETDGTISLIVLQAVPDVQDWQYSGRWRGFDNFRFHIPSQREQARSLLTSVGYYTEIQDDP